MGMKDLENIVAFPSVSWSHNWERQHEFIYRLSDKVSGKSYVHPPLGLINHSPIEILRKIRRQRQHSSELPKSSNPRKENIEFLQPRIIPYHYLCPIDTFNSNQILSATPVALDNSLVYATYANGAILRILKKSPLSVLDLAQRRQVSAHLSDRAKKTEKEAVRTASLVFADSMATVRDYQDIRPDIHYLPQGCDPDRFSGVSPDREVLEKARSFKGVIGYAGTDIVMDYGILTNLIQQLPDYLFVLVGDLKQGESRGLKELPNVFLPGRQPFEKLGSFYATFDLGLIPYKRNQHTDGVFPTKYFEYLSAGVPVLSSQLPDLVALNGPGTALSDLEHEWPDLALQLLTNRGSSREELRNFAAQNSWAARFEELWRQIELLPK